MMKTENEYIEKLIGRFLDGETTQKEEQELYRFFSGNEIPRELEVYREMFCFFSEDLPIALTYEEEFNDIPDNRLSVSANFSSKWLSWSAIAAIGLLLIGISGFLLHPANTKYSQPEVFVFSEGKLISAPDNYSPETEMIIMDALFSEFEFAELQDQMILQHYSDLLFETNQKMPAGTTILTDY